MAVAQELQSSSTIGKDCQFDSHLLQFVWWCVHGKDTWPQIAPDAYANRVWICMCMLHQCMNVTCNVIKHFWWSKTRKMLYKYRHFHLPLTIWGILRTFFLSHKLGNGEDAGVVCSLLLHLWSLIVFFFFPCAFLLLHFCTGFSGSWIYFSPYLFSPVAKLGNLATISHR